MIHARGLFFLAQIIPAQKVPAAIAPPTGITAHQGNANSFVLLLPGLLPEASADLIGLAAQSYLGLRDRDRRLGSLQLGLRLRDFQGTFCFCQGGFGLSQFSLRF